VLKDLSFEVASDQIVSILGHNGAGKSTLIRILIGFLQPDSGDVMVYGYALSKH
jgi:ABC-type multidrug transport system ATPase subunit